VGSGDRRTASHLQLSGLIRSVAFSLDGELLASGGYECKIKVWRKEGTEGINASGLDRESPTRSPLYEPKVAQPGR
jgi:WD40 repeat protein